MRLCARSCVLQRPTLSPPSFMCVCLSVCICVRSPIQKNYGCNHMTCSKVSGSTMRSPYMDLYLSLGSAPSAAMTSAGSALTRGPVTAEKLEDTFS